MPMRPSLTVRALSLICRSGHEKLLALTRLFLVGDDLATPRNALIRRQRLAVFDVRHQKLEGAMRVRLDQLGLRQSDGLQCLVGFDVGSVLDLVESVLLQLEMLGDLCSVCARLALDGQQRIQGSS